MNCEINYKGATRFCSPQIIGNMKYLIKKIIFFLWTSVCCLKKGFWTQSKNNDKDNLLVTDRAKIRHCYFRKPDGVTYCCFILYPLDLWPLQGVLSAASSAEGSEVLDIITHFLTELCSSYKHGIIFHDKTYGLSGRSVAASVLWAVSYFWGKETYSYVIISVCFGQWQ